VSTSNIGENSSSIYDIDVRLKGELRSSLRYILGNNEEKLRKLKDMNTMINLCKTARDYEQQIKEDGVFSTIINKMTDELLAQLKPYYIGSIVENIEIQTRVKRHEGTVELNSKIDLKATLNPYVEFIVEINGTRTYSIRFTFQIKTSGHLRKLTLSKNSEKGKSIHIEKLGIEIELFLVQITFSNLLTLSSDISFDKRTKLGSKSFDIRDVMLYSKSSVV
jgi:hypothetical protein